MKNSNNNLENEVNTDNKINDEDNHENKSSRKKRGSKVKLQVTNNSKNNTHQFVRRFIMDQIVEYAIREELVAIKDTINQVVNNCIFDS